MNIVVAGLGRVGATAPPVQSPCGRSMVVRNHVAAVAAVDGCRATAFVDSNMATRMTFARSNPDIPEEQLFATMDALPDAQWDLVVLCTPTETRRADVAAALAKKPRMLLLEKPLAANSTDGRVIVAACRAAGVQLRVNFNRRYDSAIVRFREKFPETPNLFIGRYNSGLNNYASHMVDLLCHWFGGVEAVRTMGRVNVNGVAPDSASYPGSDPVVSFVCHMRAGFEAHIIGVPEVEYDQFEMELLFSNSRAELVNNGVEKRFFRASPDLYYPGYAHLVEDADLRDLTPTGGFVEYYQALVEAFAQDDQTLDNDLPGCTGDEALANLLLLETVITSAKRNGRPDSLQQSKYSENSTE